MTSICGIEMRFYPSPELLDETLIEDVVLPTRLQNVFRYNDMKTVGDLRRASDRTLRSFQDFGRSSLIFVREKFGPDRSV